MSIDEKTKDEGTKRYEYMTATCDGVYVKAHGSENLIVLAPKHEYTTITKPLNRLRCSEHEVIAERYKKAGILYE